MTTRQFFALEGVVWATLQIAVWVSASASLPTHLAVFSGINILFALFNVAGLVFGLATEKFPFTSEE